MFLCRRKRDINKVLGNIERGDDERGDDERGECAKDVMMFFVC